MTPSSLVLTDGEKRFMAAERFDIGHFVQDFETGERYACADATAAKRLANKMNALDSQADRIREEERAKREGKGGAAPPTPGATDEVDSPEPSAADPACDECGDQGWVAYQYAAGEWAQEPCPKCDRIAQHWFGVGQASATAIGFEAFTHEELQNVIGCLEKIKAEHGEGFEEHALKKLKRAESKSLAATTPQPEGQAKDLDSEGATASAPASEVETLDASARVAGPYADELDRAYHLRRNVPEIAACTGCGRKSWTADEIDRACGMTQPNGEACAGTFARVWITPAKSHEYQLLSPEWLAMRFHETYERLAPGFGYETREASAVPWADVPENNRKLMIAVAAEILTGEPATRDTAQKDPTPEDGGPEAHMTESGFADRGEWEGQAT